MTTIPIYDAAKTSALLKESGVEVWSENPDKTSMVMLSFATLTKMLNAAARAGGFGKLAVWYGPMPESNGKTNWTAILHNGDVTRGHTIDQSEYEDRVRYEADFVRWLIGEISKEPDILTYDSNKHSGYVPKERV